LRDRFPGRERSMRIEEEERGNGGCSVGKMVEEV
jgi:hypothetical protein